MKRFFATIVAVATFAVPLKSFANDGGSDYTHKIVKQQLGDGVTMYATPYFDWCDNSGNRICSGYVSCLKYKNDSIVLSFAIKKEGCELFEQLSQLIELLNRVRNLNIFCSIGLEPDNRKDIWITNEMIGNAIYSFVTTAKDDLWDNSKEEVFVINMPLNACRMVNSKSMNKIWNHLKSTSFKKIHIYILGTLYTLDTREDINTKLDIPLTFQLNEIISQFDYEMKH